MGQRVGLFPLSGSTGEGWGEGETGWGMGIVRPKPLSKGGVLSRTSPPRVGGQGLTPLSQTGGAGDEGEPVDGEGSFALSLSKGSAQPHFPSGVRAYSKGSEVRRA